MGLKQKIKNKVKGGLRLHNRMILIYIIGGMLPFIAASLYTNAKNQSNMIKLNKNTQESEIEILKRQISESMTVAVDVLNQLYVSSAVNDVTRKTYDSISDFENECNARLGIIDRYLSYYKRDISDIKIFVDNKPISISFIWVMPQRQRTGISRRLKETEMYAGIMALDELPDRNISR